LYAQLSGDTDVAIGTVKWFNPVKGYGFIQPDGGGQDVFVHISAVEKAGYTSITEGLKIRYELLTTRAGKTAAAAAFACPAF
jgi:CspA family cold shock protein